MCWATKISSFGGKITYIKGSLNGRADFLSRMEGHIPRYHDTADIEESCDVNLINSDRITDADRHYSDDEGEVPPELPTLD